MGESWSREMCELIYKIYSTTLQYLIRSWRGGGPSQRLEGFEKTGEPGARDRM